MAFYSGDQYESYMMMNRMTGPYAAVYWMLITCNIVIPQLLWSQKVRRNVGAAVHHFAGRQYRDVARAVRDHRRSA